MKKLLIISLFSLLATCVSGFSDGLKGGSGTAVGASATNVVLTGATTKSSGSTATTLNAADSSVVSGVTTIATTLGRTVSVVDTNQLNQFYGSFFGNSTGLADTNRLLVTASSVIQSYKGYYTNAFNGSFVSTNNGEYFYFTNYSGTSWRFWGGVAQGYATNFAGTLLGQYTGPFAGTVSLTGYAPLSAAALAPTNGVLNLFTNYGAVVPSVISMTEGLHLLASTNANFTISAFVPMVGQPSEAELWVSNSSAGNITATVTAAYRKGNLTTTNALIIGASKFGRFYVSSFPGAPTNLWNESEP